jgi:hypothetical protein
VTSLLPDAMILDRVRPGTVRVRESGEAVNGLMGMDARGLPMRAFFELDARARAADILERVFDAPASLEMDLLCHGRNGEAPLAARLLVLPLLDHAGRPTKALCCLATDRHAGNPPCRFAVQDHALAPLHIPRAAPRRRVNDVPAGGMAELPAPFGAASSTVPWLRLVR